MGSHELCWGSKIGLRRSLSVRYSDWRPGLGRKIGTVAVSGHFGADVPLSLII